MFSPRERWCDAPIEIDTQTLSDRYYTGAPARRRRCVEQSSIVKRASASTRYCHWTTVCLYALQATIPALTRSALHRCFVRHDISRLPELTGVQSPQKKKFRSYPIGYFHVDLTEVRTAEGKLYLFVAIDRTSKFILLSALSSGLLVVQQRSSCEISLKGCPIRSTPS